MIVTREQRRIKMGRSVTIWEWSKKERVLLYEGDQRRKGRYCMRVIKGRWFSGTLRTITAKIYFIIWVYSPSRTGHKLFVPRISWKPKICDIKIPIVIASWCTTPNAPRMFEGAISDKYIGVRQVVKPRRKEKFLCKSKL